MSTLLDRCFPPDECDPMVGLPRIHQADVCRSGFIAVEALRDELKAEALARFDTDVAS